MSGYLSLADGRAIAVRDGFVIGRGAGCDLVLDDGKASRKHLRIVVAGGVVEVEDLGSSNGTMLNGKPVTRRMLRGGDEVQIGTTVMVYREGAVPGAAAPAAAAGKAVVFDDEDDLFGGDAAPAAAPARPAAPASAPAAPPPAPVQAPRAEAVPAPPAAPPKTAVVEFADEVVEVRKPPPTAAPKAAPAAEPAVASKQRILQFSQNAGRGGMLGDDLGQMSGGKRGLLIAIVLAAAGALAFAVMKLVR